MLFSGPVAAGASPPALPPVHIPLVVLAIAATNAEVAQLNPLAVLLTPFGLMEVGAYSIAMSRSTLLAKDVIRKNWNQIKNDKTCANNNQQ